jgi:hypothetical protein
MIFFAELLNFLPMSHLQPSHFYTWMDVFLTPGNQIIYPQAHPSSTNSSILKYIQPHFFFYFYLRFNQTTDIFLICVETFCKVAKICIENYGRSWLHKTATLYQIMPLKMAIKTSNGHNFCKHSVMAGLHVVYWWNGVLKKFIAILYFVQSTLLTVYNQIISNCYAVDRNTFYNVS